MVRVSAEDGNVLEHLFALHVDELAYISSPRFLYHGDIFLEYFSPVCMSWRKPSSW